jgi:4-amino-4-deoxy-L-arabinose transferase-like glycosyltransferase/Tfp pilus assembly protein PilF
VIGLCALAFAVRALHVLASRQNPFFHYLPVDSGAYDRWGRAIAAGNWLGTEIFYQDPLYPYFLGLFYRVVGHHLTALLLLQAALGALNVILLYRIATRLWNPRVGLVAALLAALYAPFLFYDGLVLKTFLEVLLLNGWLLALLGAADAGEGGRSRWGRAGLAGLLLGLGALTRANYLLLLPVGVIWLFLVLRGQPGWGRRAGRLSLALLAGFLCVILPVTWRNHAVGGEWVPLTSQGGQNFYIGNNPGNDRGTYVAPPFVRSDPRFEQRDFRGEAERRLGRPVGPSEASSFWFRQGLEALRADPGRGALRFLRKLGLLFHHREIPDNHDIRFAARYSPWLRWDPIVFGLIGPLAALGLVLGWKRRGRLAILYVVAGVYLVSIAVFFVFSRYRLPAVSLLLIFAAGGIIEAWDAWRDRQRRRLLLGAVGLILGLWLAYRPVAGEEAPGSPALLTNLGMAYLEEGKTDEALATQRRAVELAPQSPEAQYNLGITLYRTGHAAESVDAFERAIELKPDYAEAYSYLGNVRLELGNAEEALRDQQEAMRLDPGNAIHPYNAARTLLLLGRNEEALDLVEKLRHGDDPQYSIEALVLGALGRSAMGDRDGAVSWMREYLRERPQSPERATFEGLLRAWEGAQR